jgi:hypothetical protein
MYTHPKKGIENGKFFRVKWGRSEGSKEKDLVIGISAFYTCIIFPCLDNSRSFSAHHSHRH